MSAYEIICTTDRKKVVVWIGADGRNAVHPGNGSYCIPCDLRTAHLVVRWFKLRSIDKCADGAAFTA